MTRKIDVFSKVIKYLKETTVGENDFSYAIFYGLFSVVILLLKQIFTFIFYDDSQISNLQNYYIILSFSLVLLICFIIIHAMKLTEKNKLALYFIKIYPFLYILLGMIIISTYAERNAKMLSYIVIMISLFWIQIYKPIRRIGVFLFSAISYLGLSYITFGLTENFYLDLPLVGMTSIIVFIASTILSMLHYSHKETVADLDIKNKQYSFVIDNLKSTYSSLKISKKITDNMYELTQEVLKNENIEDVFQLVLDKATTLIPKAQAGSILILENNTMKFVAANGYDLEKLKKIELGVEETFQGTLEDKYEPTIIRNLKVFDEVHLGKEKTKRMYESAVFAKSCMTCSFKYQDEFFGSINIDNFDSEDIFTKEDKYLIKQLAQEIEIIISVHKLYEQALRPTKFDELTQAKSRRYCMKLLDDLMDKEEKTIISICTMDINNLKKINDEFGHDAGDKYLFEFAQAVRNSGIADNIFGRVGGDEFILIFNKLTKEETMQQIQVIKKYLKKHLIQIGNKNVEISFASGVSVYGVDSKEIMELIKVSDKRMYEDKFIQKKTQ